MPRVARESARSPSSFVEFLTLVPETQRILLAERIEAIDMSDRGAILDLHRFVLAMLARGSISPEVSDAMHKWVNSAAQIVFRNNEASTGQAGVEALVIALRSTATQARTIQPQYRSTIDTTAVPALPEPIALEQPESAPAPAFMLFDDGEEELK